MVSPRTILRYLKNLPHYLAQFHLSQQSIYFEKLITEALSHVLYLQFFTANNDNPSIPHRVIWQGSTNPLSKSPPQGPDGIAYCYNFCVTIEATLKTGANQWSQEFAQSIRHCEDFCNQRQIQQKDAFAIMVCTAIHRDSYQSIRNNPRQEYTLFPMMVSDLAKILETSILAITIRHIELRRLFHQLSDCIRNSASLADYLQSSDDLIKKWQKNVLSSEKSVFIGLKSYEAMRRIGRNAIGVSEILQQLQKHPYVAQYLNIIGTKLTIIEIENDLVQQSLACSAGRTIQDNETLFEAVPSTDFKGRGHRLIDAVARMK
jgi:hypothetical protein